MRRIRSNLSEHNINRNKNEFLEHSSISGWLCVFRNAVDHAVFGFSSLWVEPLEYKLYLRFSSLFISFAYLWILAIWMFNLPNCVIKCENIIYANLIGFIWIMIELKVPFGVCKTAFFFLLFFIKTDTPVGSRILSFFLLFTCHYMYSMGLYA